MIFNPPQVAKPDNSGAYVFLFAGFVCASFSLLIIKLARDFYALKTWTYRWMEFEFKKNPLVWWWLRKDFYRADVRKAFGQPDLEYPEFPEYGPKFDDSKEKQ